MNHLVWNTVANVKNRLVPIRYLYKSLHLAKSLWNHCPSGIIPPTTEPLAQLRTLGFFEAQSTLPEDKLDWIRQAAMERIELRVAQRRNDYPFLDLLTERDFAEPNNPIIEAIFSEQLLLPAAWYFQGRPKLTRCFLAYTKPDPSQNWKQTQLWHFDSDDFRMLRVVLYLTDVEAGAGPFLFLSKRDSPPRPRVWSRRLTDSQLPRLCCRTDLPVRTFSGRAGSLLFIDSAQCLHCGGRSIDQDRLCLVVTFTSQTPCNRMHTLIRRYRHTLYQSLQEHMPHLPPALLQSLLLS